MAGSMRSLRVGIVSSVGGHLSEAMELAPVLRGCELFWVLNDQAPWRGGFASARMYRITHAERDARVLLNLGEAAGILWRERPDVLISTGASPAVPFFLLGKCLGIGTLYIESFSSVQRPSLTGRLIVPLADHFFVQWPQLLRTFPHARYAGPLFVPLFEHVPDSHQTIKDPPVQILVVVGSSVRPCHRLLSWLDEWLGARPGEPRPSMLVQSSVVKQPPRHFQTVSYVPAALLEHHLRTATNIVCHGGAGVLGLCLKWGRHPIVIPRRAAYGEAINDHQEMLCEELSARGLITMCESQLELAAALEHAARPRGSGTCALPEGLHAAVGQILRQAAISRHRTYCE